MAEWTDRGVALGLRRFGETQAILDVFTRNRGRARGLVHGGASRKRRSVLQPGNTLQLVWRARLADDLGHFAQAEPETERSARHLMDSLALSALTSVASLLNDALPEGEAKPGLFDATETLLDVLGDVDVWPALFVRWELGLLTALGYGLDLSRCALSGATDGLTHVSPRSGRAVRADAAAEWLDRLLPLPGFLVSNAASADGEAVGQGFRLTGWFLERRLFGDLNKPVPEPRDLMIDRLERAGRLSFPAGADSPDEE
ncbi:DNA repair protein RecO [bacterium]|nr:DNA repair protein RecO [bacterium]